MNKTFLITSSPNPNSVSSSVAKLALAESGYNQVETLDTAASPVPAYGVDLMSAIYAGSTEARALDALRVSDAYVDQLLAADIVVVAIAMHNFGVPSGLKAWMDQVARPGKTFEYTASGPRGLVSGRKALLVMASGGDYSGPAAAYEHAASHAAVFFGFLGFEVEVVMAPGQSGASAAAGRESALSKAKEALSRWSKA